MGLKKPDFLGFFFLTQYEVYSKFEYDNMWGYRPRIRWILSEWILLQFEPFQL